MKNAEFLFVGVREDLLALAVRQDVERLAEYKEEPRVFSGTVHAVFPRGQVEEFELDDDESRSRSYYVRRDLKGSLLATSGGLVLGFLSGG